MRQFVGAHLLRRGWCRRFDSVPGAAPSGAPRGSLTLERECVPSWRYTKRPTRFTVGVKRGERPHVWGKRYSLRAALVKGCASDEAARRGRFAQAGTRSRVDGPLEGAPIAETGTIACACTSRIVGQRMYGILVPGPLPRRRTTTARSKGGVTLRGRRGPAFPAMAACTCSSRRVESTSARRKEAPDAVQTTIAPRRL